MKIQISGKGVHRREVPGIEKLRGLPPEWYAFTNLELLEPGSMPRQIDIVVVLDDRILIADLKDWNGRISSDGDRWFQNDRSVDTSPVKKVLENARIMATLLARFLNKQASARRSAFNRWEVPLIEGCVILTGRCDTRDLAELEKPRVFGIDDFCRFVQDPRERIQRLAPPQWIDRVEPYTATGSRWRDTLGRFFGAAEGYFKPLEKRYGDYRAVSDDTYSHPKGIYTEYDAEEVSVSRGFGLLRLWDFSRAEPRYASEEGRSEIAGREQDIINYLVDRQPQLETALLRPKTADPVRGIHYWEVFERRRQLRRLRDFLQVDNGELTTSSRLSLARSLLSHVAAMHRVRAAHLDIGAHSVWMELPSVVRLSHLVAASYPILTSLGSRRFGFLASGTVLPEHIVEQVPDHFRKDVFLLGVVVHSILFGTPPLAPTPDEPPVWDPQVDERQELEHLHAWFSKSLDMSSVDRFADAQQMLDEFNSCLAERDRGPNAVERLQRFRRWKSVRELYREYPEAAVIKETDRLVSWTSIKGGKTVLVKTWRRACWGDEVLESPRLAMFCEQAEALSLTSLPGMAEILDVGYLGDHLVLIQEWLDAQDLSRHRKEREQDWLKPGVALNFLKELTSTITALHDNNFTHGDITPANVIVRWDDDGPHPILVDILDFGPTSEGDIRTSEYSPTYNAGTKERDRFGLLKIAEELVVTAPLSADTLDAISSAIRTCRDTPPLLSTVLPLLEALDQALKPPHPEPSPILRISFPGLRMGPLMSDEGRYYVWPHSDRRLTITGNREELVVVLDPSRAWKIVSLQRIEVRQSLVSSAERKCSVRLPAQIEVVPGILDVSPLDEIVKSVYSTTPVVPGEQASVKAAPVIDELAEVLDEDVPGVQEPEALEPPRLDVANLWETLLKVEEELIPQAVAQFDSSYSRDRRRHMVALEETSGTIDFTREDRVTVELATKSGAWVPIGVLDLDLSTGQQIAVDASMYRARDGSQLCPAGSELRFRSVMEADSRARRSTATRRLLTRNSVLPNLVDYLGWTPPEPKRSGLSVDPSMLSTQYGLNESQSDAFRTLLDARPLGLLQGPPGTGKTKFIAALAHYLLSTGAVSNVLIASQSHEAVNTATEGILRLFHKANCEPSLIRVGQEGSVSELLKPYHSAKVEAHYRETFRAGLKTKFVLAARQIGVPVRFAEELFVLETTVFPIYRQLQSLQERTDDKPANAEARIASLRQTLTTLEEQLDLSARGGINWSDSSAYETAVTLLAEKNKVASGDQVRRMRGISDVARDWMGSVSGARRSFEEFLANTRQIVSGTCVGLGRTALGLSSARFDLVIIDEAARCTPSELAVPIQSGKWILLVGDHLQLEPFHDPIALKEVWRRLRIPVRQIVKSDFERSFGSSYGKAIGQTLTTQYRMLPDIGTLVSDSFYKGQLKSGRFEPKAPDHIWPDTLKSQLTWIATDRLGPEAYQRRTAVAGRSLSNQSEVNAIADVMRQLDSHAPFVEWLGEHNMDEVPIGIICTYAAQSQAIRQKLRSIGLSPKLQSAYKVGTVDSYQGKENLLVILSLVRNNEDGPGSGVTRTIAPGFLATPNRVNVALSRAMDRLVIVGASQRWPPGGPIDAVTTTYRRLCEEGRAVLRELSPDQPSEDRTGGKSKKASALKSRARKKTDVKR